MAPFDRSNLPYWLLLGMGLLLFLVVILSGGGDNDIDLDGDADLDIEGDVDGDVDGFELGHILGWFGIGQAPLILLLATDLSLWGLLGWFLNVVLFGGSPGIIFSSSLMVALLLGKAIAHPLGKIFASFGEDASSDRLVGCLGTVSTSLIPPAAEGKIGQVDVLDPARNRVTVNAILPEWATLVPQRGNQVLVIDRNGPIYVVIVKDSPDQESWFSQSSRSTPSR